MATKLTQKQAEEDPESQRLIAIAYGLQLDLENARIAYRDRIARLMNGN